MIGAWLSFFSGVCAVEASLLWLVVRWRPFSWIFVNTSIPLLPTPKWLTWLDLRQDSSEFDAWPGDVANARALRGCDGTEDTTALRDFERSRRLRFRGNAVKFCTTCSLF